MPKKGQRTVTFSGKSLKQLERAYERENVLSFYKMSFAGYIAANALAMISLRRKHKVK